MLLDCAIFVQSDSNYSFANLISILSDLLDLHHSVSVILYVVVCHTDRIISVLTDTVTLVGCSFFSVTSIEIFYVIFITFGFVSMILTFIFSVLPWLVFIIVALIAILQTITATFERSPASSSTFIALVGQFCLDIHCEVGSGFTWTDCNIAYIQLIFVFQESFAWLLSCWIIIFNVIFIIFISFLGFTYRLAHLELLFYFSKVPFFFFIVKLQIFSGYS